ncbi:hypothetical protein BJY04DRAFT_216338 [Aspergillus karnatakaensis]|uniref:uncharacterized protein n=1 Tax=Aspergillus karnatakaensis TaxID=1810916 RepID=UPI003CCDEDD5
MGLKYDIAAIEREEQAQSSPGTRAHICSLGPLYEGSKPSTYPPRDSEVLGLAESDGMIINRSGSRTGVVRFNYLVLVDPLPGKEAGFEPVTWNDVQAVAELEGDMQSVGSMTLGWWRRNDGVLVSGIGTVTGSWKDVVVALVA